jgi:hypothetical protein
VEVTKVVLHMVWRVAKASREGWLVNNTLQKFMVFQTIKVDYLIHFDSWICIFWLEAYSMNDTYNIWLVSFWLEWLIWPYITWNV